MKEINFVFENLEENLNFVNCTDLNNSGIARFTTSPIAQTCIKFLNKTNQFKINAGTTFSKNKIVIIATGVAHSPPDWAGYLDIGKRYHDSLRKTNSILYYLNDEYIQRLRDKTAFLLIDQTHEGYHAEWLYEWFHDMCTTYDVSPSQMIYTTGDLDSDKKYSAWCTENNVEKLLNIVPIAHFEYVIHTTLINRMRTFRLPHGVTLFADHLLHKDSRKNRDNVKLYNCLQKRPRAHRAWLFYELYKNNLLDDGLITMNSFTQKNSYYEGKDIPQEDYDKFIDMLPIFPTSRTSTKDHHAFESTSGSTYITDLNHKEMMNSWISVISEADFAGNQCFVSEKSFKPIANLHPFIIYGNKGSLKRLHEMGYKTFDKWWDEGYDNLETWDRLNAIINILKALQSLSHGNLVEMYKEMQPTLEYNFKRFQENSNRVNPGIEKILRLTYI